MDAARKYHLPLNGEGLEWVLLRVEAGPSNRDAFDQAWLKSFDFREEPSAQTTSAK